MKTKTTQQMNLELQSKFPFLEIISEYKGANEKVTIRCNDCGYTWDAVARSVKSSKHGCKNCKAQKTRTENSKNKFLEKLDTTKFEFVEFKSGKEITLKCKKCGYIRTTNMSNIYKYGCPKCGQERTHNAQRMTKEEFIEKAKQIHNNSYSYDKVNYINYHTPVIITCPIHGDFAQMPSKHLIGHRCISCANKDMTTEKFILRAKEIHGDKYDYSKVVYKTMSDKVCIICPEHGEFWQNAFSHVSNCGCPNCNRSKGEELVSKILTEFNIKYIEQFVVKSDLFETREYIKVDFYLPDYNAFIEYNGEQHYVPVERFGGQIAFESQLSRDENLRTYCKQNGIKLLEIKYNDVDVDLIIDEFLNNSAV